MRQKLVSVVTPMYNTGAYVHRLLESILLQDYPYIEMIVVNDGSTDNSENVVKSFKDKFIHRGYTLRYIKQPNSGQSVALQNGIDNASGKYLIWPDSDDFYASKTAISELVDALEASPNDVGMARGQLIMVEDSPNLTPIKILGENIKGISEEELFLDCLFHQNDFYFAAGAFLIDIDKFKQCSDLPIYTSHDAGQNWQLLLPILYKYRCVSIPRPLHNVLIRKESHSHGINDYGRHASRLLTYRDTILGTIVRIKDMGEEEREKYRYAIMKKYARRSYEVALLYDKYAEAYELYKALEQYGGATTRQKVDFFMVRMGIYGIFKKIRDNIKKRLSHG